MDDSIFNELARFDAQYRPDQGILPSLDSLPDGGYEFEVVQADVARTPNTGDAILKMALRVNGGSLVERAYFFKSQDHVNRLGAELVALGFTQFERTQGFAAELRAVLPKLKGVRFRGTKSTETGKDGKTYHKLFIAGRVSGAAARPMPTAAPANATANAQAQGGAAGTKEVPF